jgi:phage terminase Nu1 subunit (DNA packaging protein)
MALKAFPPVRRQDMPGILGISLRQFTDLETRGVLAPMERGQGNRPGLYDVRATVRAYLRHREQESQRDRLFRLQADKVALDLSVRQGELVEAATVDAEWKNIAVVVRRAVLALPGRLLQCGIIAIDQLGAATEECSDVLRHLGKAGSA